MAGGNVEVLDYLLSHGFSVDKPFTGPWTPLTFCIMDGDVALHWRINLPVITFTATGLYDVMMYFLSKGADPELPVIIQRETSSPLMLACQQRECRHIECL